MNKTLNFYSTNSKVYFESTKRVDLTHIYDDFLSYIPKGGQVLDLGCGSGRDSLYFKNLGYKVTAIDGCKELCELASEYLGFEVINETFEGLDLAEESFNGIWACASLLHVKRCDIKNVLNNLAKGLKDNGVFYMSFKYGDKEFVDEKERYFNCYDEEGLKELIKDIENLGILKFYKTEDVMPNRENLVWLNVLCIKDKSRKAK